MLDKAFAVIFFPFVVWILIFCWLVYMTRKGKPLKLVIKGLGISIDLDTTGTRRRRHNDIETSTHEEVYRHRSDN